MRKLPASQDSKTDWTSSLVPKERADEGTATLDRRRRQLFEGELPIVCPWVFSFPDEFREFKGLDFRQKKTPCFKVLASCRYSDHPMCAELLNTQLPETSRRTPVQAQGLRVSTLCVKWFVYVCRFAADWLSWAWLVSKAKVAKWWHTKGANKKQQVTFW